jgi:V/A-type H+/Na+-transporting ATPase subunit F
VKTLVFITERDSEYGFRLAGITHYAVEKKEAEETLRKAIAVRETGLVVVDERLMNGIEEEKINALQQGWHGILLVLPSPEKPETDEEDYALRLIRRAIGYHVRVKT